MWCTGKVEFFGLVSFVITRKIKQGQIMHIDKLMYISFFYLSCCSRDSGRSEENYSDFLLDTSINYSKNFSEDTTMSTVKQGGYGGEQQQLLDNSISSPASYSYASSLLQTLFDTDSQPPLHTNGFLPMVKQQPWNATSAPLADVRPTNFVPSPSSRFLPSSLTNHSIGAKVRIFNNFVN